MRKAALMVILFLISSATANPFQELLNPFIEFFINMYSPTSTTTSMTSSTTTSSTATSTTTSTTMTSTSTTSTSTTSTTLSLCGNGVLDKGEDCDTGKTCQHAEGVCRINGRWANCMADGDCMWNVQTAVTGEISLGRCSGCYGPKHPNHCTCITSQARIIGATTTTLWHYSPSTQQPPTTTTQHTYTTTTQHTHTSTTQYTYTTTTQKSSGPCTDSDGRDSHTKGCAGYYGALNPCETCDLNGEYVGYCSAKQGTCSVKELTCQNGKLEEEKITCPTACLDGACIDYELSQEELEQMQKELLEKLGVTTTTNVS